MPEETDFLSLFEGLNSQQAKELRERIIPTLQQVREQIIQGETMTREADIDAIFQDMTLDEVREAMEAYRRPAQEATAAKQAELTSLDEAEAAELAGLKERGSAYTERKHAILAKYKAQRARDDQEPQTDPELDAAKESDLGRIYKQRLAAIPRGDVRRVSELRSLFARYGYSNENQPRRVK